MNSACVVGDKKGNGEGSGSVINLLLMNRGTCAVNSSYAGWEKVVYLLMLYC